MTSLLALQIAHNVVIGKSCLLCGQVGIAGSVTYVASKTSLAIYATPFLLAVLKLSIQLL